MKRNYLLFILTPMVIGILLLAVGFCLLRPTDGQSGQKALAPFHSIDLSVLSADVTVAEGDTYAVSYRLYGRETVKKAEVIDNTLVFKTGFDPIWKPAGSNWSVLITVPAGTEFDTLRIKSVAGDLSLSGYSFRTGEFETTSGAISIAGGVCESLVMKTVSHDLSLTASTVSTHAELETVSGNITIRAPFGAVQAESIGKIRFNGADQGRKFSISQDGPAVLASSVSGKIVIDME